MTATDTSTRPSSAATEHFDVLIVGAGISGIGSAYHLATQRPGTSFVVLDALGGFGGTWWTHRYPGVRSDSDLHTYGYRFKPWTGAPIASAEEILKYVGDVIDENGLAQHIRYHHKILTADWSSTDNLWTIDALDTQTGESRRFTTGFLWMCQGYYRHSEGYTPEWEGLADFQGQVVHPQSWPDDLDLEGKRVVVIGSGATAATVVPAIANTAAAVTILQRSPTYFLAGRNRNDLAETLRTLEIDPEWIHEIVRRQIIHEQAVFTKRAFDEPEKVKTEMLAGVRAFLGPDFDVERHFTPNYLPWRQRIAVVPNGDLFQSIRSGKVSVVTDEIERFTASGIRLKSGEELEADIVVTATGFNMNVLGDIEFAVDGAVADFAKTLTYRGMIFTGVPNLLWVFGYFRSSYTLRADLLGDFVCRLLDHMDAKGARRVDVQLRAEDGEMELLPWVDPEAFNPGYVTRALHQLPRRGDKPEWQHSQDYLADAREIPAIDLDGPEFAYA